MLGLMTFREALHVCAEDIQKVTRGLEMLESKKETIRKFFVTAHRLGQSLNRGSSASVAPDGFKLSALKALEVTKSTKHQQLSMLHFVLSLMPPSDVEGLFQPEDVETLKLASQVGTRRVYQESLDIVQMFFSVQRMCEDGHYISEASKTPIKMERRRKSIYGQRELLTETTVDHDDRFHEVMQNFVDTFFNATTKLVRQALRMVLLYRNLTILFGDVKSVWPPPKTDTENEDTKYDLCSVFYTFAASISKRDDEELCRLREELGLQESP
jgi:hypothetical protein